MKFFEVALCVKLLRIQDPLYGFISVAEPELQKLLAHPYVQRLRRISQLGLIELVYPSATHTRFQHALGSMHLMREVLSHLQLQSTPISSKEKTAALSAALLHDIGHSPLSHNLEGLLLPQTHEEIGEKLMKKIEEDLDIDLSLARDMIRSQYSRPFFSELLSSLLDVDRMDYLHRDSYFTGVAEGKINIHRLLEVLYVEKERIYVLQKGLPTLEDFFHARRMMYLQVYHHKVVLSARCMLEALIRRAKVIGRVAQLPSSISSLTQLVLQEGTIDDQIRTFVNLQDAHIWIALQYWAVSSDKVLSQIASGLLERKLWTVQLSYRPFSDDFLYSLGIKVENILHLPQEEIDFFIGKGCIEHQLPLIVCKEEQLYTEKLEANNVSKDKREDTSERTVSSLEIHQLTKETLDKKLYYVCYSKTIT